MAIKKRGILLRKHLKDAKDRMCKAFMEKLPSNKFDRYNMEWAYRKGVTDGYKYYEKEANAKLALRRLKPNGESN